MKRLIANGRILENGRLTDRDILIEDGRIKKNSF